MHVVHSLRSGGRCYVSSLGHETCGEDMGASSLGVSKREGEVDEVMAIAATSVDCSSSLSLSPEMYSSLVTNTILEGDFLLGKFFLRGALLKKQRDT